jgi:hypothetical protein
MTDAFNAYVFSDNVVLGDWCQPLPDPELYTQGGSWLVKVIDKAQNKELSADDTNYLIGKRLNAWTSELDSATGNEIKTDGLTDDIQEWAIERATKYIQNYKG